MMFLSGGSLLRCCLAGTLYAFLNVAAGLLFYRLYGARVSTKADLVKILAHPIAICLASVAESSCTAAQLLVWQTPNNEGT